MRTLAVTAFGLSALAVVSCRSARPDDDVPDFLQDPAESEVEAAEDYLDEEWDRLTLAEQKRAFLVQKHIGNARGLLARLQLDDAELELARALDLDADNLEAKQLLDEVGALTGRGAGQARTVVRRLEDEYRLRKQQAEADARDYLQKGRLALARAEYDRAIVELTLGLDIVTLSPYSGEWQDIEQEARRLLNATRAQQEQADLAAREMDQREAREQLRSQEQAEQQRKQAVIDNLTDQAITAFRMQEYDEAIDLADRVLRLDPRNERAMDIHDTSFRKGRNLVRENYLRKKREQYARWQQELEELRIPYQGVVMLPDEDTWKRITAARARRRGLDLSQTVSPAETELRRQLAETRIPGFSIQDEESLALVVEAVRLVSDVPIVVDPLADDAALTEGVVFDFNLTHPLSVEKVLNLITQMAGPDVAWTIRHDTVLVTTRDKARGELVIYNHDVQDLIFGLTDFLGPRIDRLRLIDDLEDEDGGSPFGAIGERPSINDPDDLATLVQENVSVGTWEDDGVSITVEGGNMVVVQTADVQVKVRQFLEELRRFSASLVTIESKFLVLQDAFLQEIGFDFRGLDNPGDPYPDLDDLNLDLNPTLGLDNSGDGQTITPPSAGTFYDDGADGDFKGRTEHIFGQALGGVLSDIGGLTAQFTYLNDINVSAILRMVEKTQNLELINDQVVSVHNTQRAYVTVINQRAYVQDFDVEVAQFQAIADPVINVLTEGIVLDVRPTINHNRRYLTLEVQPTVAQVVRLTDFSTTLAGQTAAVTLQLPELEVQSVFTTAHVPDGGSILIGGLSRLRNIERRAEVPWLANIPIIGFFFKEEGYSDERESLIILITAWITDVKEEIALLDAR